MQRYFASIINNVVNFDESDIHHILHVMRMKKGDRIEVVSNEELFLCEIQGVNPLSTMVISKIESHVELPYPLTLFFVLAKGDKNELVIQKATELGVSRIVFLNSGRSVVKIDDKTFAKKLERYQKIAKEASEQCHRLKVPEIIGLFDISNIPDNLLEDVNYVAYEKESSNGTLIPDKINSSTSILVGSEGGLEENEVNKLINEKKFIPVSLGKRILRCETAAIYSLSVLSYIMEK